MYVDKNNKIYVDIFDKNNCLVCKTKTSKPCLDVFLKKNNIYTLIICYRGYKIRRVIYTNQNSINIYFNYLNNSASNSRPITFNLFDYYYNLPIERGVLNFGQASNNN